MGQSVGDVVDLGDAGVRDRRVATRAAATVRAAISALGSRSIHALIPAPS
jgi:hypothetical protein